MLVTLFIALFVGVSNAATHLQCQKLCTAQYDPVCGSDHKTYSNMCKLQIAECNAKLDHRYLHMASKGACHTVNPSIDTSYSCQSPNICDEEIKLVCGSDGVTYKNPCFLHEAACKMLKNGQRMQELHSGECTKAEQSQECPHFCDTTLDPVCSKGNTTYRNGCFLKQTYCRYAKYGTSYASRYELLHNGTCDGSDPTQTVKLDCSKYVVQGAIAVEGSGGVLVQCPHTTLSHDRHYVCSTDHHTYYDECSYCRMMVSKHQLASDNTVDVLALGRCPSYLSSYVIG